MTNLVATIDVASERQLDSLLSKVHRTSPLWATNLANHAPMAAEALTRLGRADAIDDFYASYQSNLEEWPIPARAALANWQAHRGERTSIAALVGHFDHRISEDGVESVLREVVPQLYAGVLAGAFHGLIRASHAYRSWRRVDSEGRSREVAMGLGYWAAEYVTLAGDVGSAAIAGNDVATALHAVSPLPTDLHVDGIITDRAKAADQSAAFLLEVSAVDLDAWPVSKTLSELCGAAAKLMLATDNRRARFAYMHALTASNAWRELLPLLDQGQQRRALMHHWHAVAAVHCMCAGSPAASGTLLVTGEPPPPSPTPEALVALAVGSLDDHAIKVTAAALQEVALSDNVELLRAAWCYAAAAG